jgi:hypothetical protein
MAIIFELRHLRTRYCASYQALIAKFISNRILYNIMIEEKIENESPEYWEALKKKQLEEELEKIYNLKYVCRNCGNVIDAMNYPMHGNTFCMMPLATEYPVNYKKIKASTFVKKFINKI